MSVNNCTENNLYNLYRMQFFVEGIIKVKALLYPLCGPSKCIDIFTPISSFVMNLIVSKLRKYLAVLHAVNIINKPEEYKKKNVK